MTFNSIRKSAAAGVAVAAMLGLTTNAPAFAQAKASKAQQTQDKMMAGLPHCSAKLGTISVVNGDDPSGWTNNSLAAPQKLLKVIVQKSGCFSLVDRGAGMDAAQRERDIGGSLGLQHGSNMGKGQIKAADFVLVAEVGSADSNTGGGGAAGLLGGLVGGRAGAIVGGFRTKKSEADVVLSLTDVRTSESNSFEGHAAKNDLSWGAGGGIGFGGAVGGGYEDTDIGKIVTQAFIVAYAEMVNNLGGIDVGGKEAAPSRSFTVRTATTLRSAPNATGKVIRALPVGLTVYPTGNKDGMYWEVADDNDNVGWVKNDSLAASQ
ncbi:CsgG/HfaB family protein [Asticcacaulis taihuensis]|uniref:Curli biogenesis system outer membrane secretion channel CsgG n=1 Tax=Asticcacaulis taihuensis TaxID=260084 RepID=A0A1G4TCM7_9CAUL|nr:CsgG/HfaB family protein [Asticcacaulis taihuensis]SCW78339.1 Curli biogenesis system outer membrane secretion channel CsgG [Asticcacaulis taihuensis]